MSWPEPTTAAASSSSVLLTRLGPASSASARRAGVSVASSTAASRRPSCSLASGERSSAGNRPSAFPPLARHQSLNSAKLTYIVNMSPRCHVTTFDRRSTWKWKTFFQCVPLAQRVVDSYLQCAFCKCAARIFAFQHGDMSTACTIVPMAKGSAVQLQQWCNGFR